MSFNCNVFVNFDVFYNFKMLCVLSFYLIFYLFKSETNHKTSQNSLSKKRKEKENKILNYLKFM